MKVVVCGVGAQGSIIARRLDGEAGLARLGVTVDEVVQTRLY
jgi:hypothetical protein